MVWNLEESIDKYLWMLSKQGVTQLWIASIEISLNKSERVDNLVDAQAT